METTKKRATFTGNLGYVLATAGASVGLGNIWRFPYLAAKYGGGMFLLVYLILAVTFGFTMIMAESVLGRLTKKSPVGAFRHFGDSLPFKLGGWINAVIPMIIVPYYAVIGGWVVKYLVEYVKGNGMQLAEDGYFTSFITSDLGSEIWLLVFAAAVFIVILLGVVKGIELTSKFIMPVLVILAFVVMLYSVTRPGAIEGVKYFLIPNLKNFSLMTIVAAMGQMFYSLSIAMGILYTYGSYIKKEVDIEKSTTQVEIFDTVIAVMAGLMIIPAVFAFSGGSPETLNAGPSLMFITLPKVFASTGMCNLIGIVFFFLVFFAALTSAIALMESCISTLQDELKWSRPVACVFMAVIMLIIGTLSAMGYGSLSSITIGGLAFLDFFDFLSNSLMMPIAAVATCLLILCKVGLATIAEEVEISSEFKRKNIFNFCLKYLAMICLTLIFVSSILSILGIISI